MKKASPLKSEKKSMASFMTARLSSARCEGGPGNPPLPMLKTEKEREQEIYIERKRERVENGQAILASLWQHLHRGQRIRSWLICSWFRHSQCKTLANQFTCVLASCWGTLRISRESGTNYKNPICSRIDPNAQRGTGTHPTSSINLATNLRDSFKTDDGTNL